MGGTGTSWQRIGAAFGIAAIYALAVYLIIDWVRPDSGFVTFTFALIQPAILCAFIAFVGDPMGRRRLSYYMLVPAVLAAGMIVLAASVLQEGVVCIVMLAPVWLISGMAGTYLVYRFRPDPGELDHPADTFRASALLAIPLVLMPLEEQLPVPVDRYTVSRSIQIDAPQQAIWQLMQTVPALAKDEGQWNVTQDIIGIPRPIAARLAGSGVGAIRMARWEHGIAFNERVTHWQPGQRIHWAFEFPQNDGWDFTDRHLHPDSAYMQVESGGYRLEQQSGGSFRLTLETRYEAATHINAYAALWGEFFLGDIQSNLLAAIKARAEAGR